MSQGKLPPYAEKALDLIDACFFSGDTFQNAAALETADYYIGRWTREIARIKEDLAAEGADNDPA